MAEHDPKPFEKLTAQQAGSWIEIARALHAVESISQVSPTGHAWQELLRERLEALGQPISVGHLAKIRRAHDFLIKHAPSDVGDERLRQARISAVEVAERLHRIDPEQGKEAVKDLFADNPVTYVELQLRYDDAMDANPERRSLRQLAWAARKDPAPKASKAPVGSATAPQVTAAPDREGPSELLQTSLFDLTQRIWMEGQDAGRRRAAGAIAERDRSIARLTKKIALLAEEKNDLESANDMLSEEARITANKYRELRDYGFYDDNSD